MFVVFCNGQLESGIKPLCYLVIIWPLLLPASEPGLNYRLLSICKNKFPHLTLKLCPSGKCLVTKHDQTLFGDQKFSRLDILFGVVGLC